jgi:hypothetical protein
MCLFLQVMKSRPKGWTFATSNTGEVTGLVMMEFAAALQKVLVQKGLLEKSVSKQRVILFLKNHPAYMGMDFVRFCDDHGIIVFCLPLNATSNPLQSAVATHFANIWAIEQQQLPVTKTNIGYMLAEALKQIKCNAIKTSFGYAFQNHLLLFFFFLFFLFFFLFFFLLVAPFILFGFGLVSEAVCCPGYQLGYPSGLTTRPDPLPGAFLCRSSQTADQGLP